jgi:hypothetical protein
MCGSVWAVDFLALVDHMVTFNAGFQEFASVTISAEHFFLFHLVGNLC